MFNHFAGLALEGLRMNCAWLIQASSFFSQKSNFSLYTWKAFVQLYHSCDKQNTDKTHSQKLRIKFNFGVYDQEKFPVAGPLRNFVKFTGKYLCQSLFLDEGLRPEKRLWQRCFRVNFAKFLKTLFLTEHLRWQLLKSIRYEIVSDLIESKMCTNRRLIKLVFKTCKLWRENQEV